MHSLLRDAMHSVDYIVVRCPSAQRRYCIETAKHIINTATHSCIDTQLNINIQFCTNFSRPCTKYLPEAAVQYKVWRLELFVTNRTCLKTV